MDDIAVVEDTKTVTKTKAKKPRRYAVIFHNDDFTPMDFVIYILIQLFHKQYEDAHNIMMVHTEGSAVVEIYTKEIAEEKASDAMKVAEENGYPLRATSEPYDGDDD